MEAKTFLLQKLWYRRGRISTINKELARQRGPQFDWNINNRRTRNLQKYARLFQILNKKFKKQHNEMILSLQYCKLLRDNNESAKLLMGHLRIKVNEHNYQKLDRRLKEQFINGINDKALTSEIIKELTTIENISEVTSEQVLVWPRRVEAQRSQKAI